MSLEFKGESQARDFNLGTIGCRWHLKQGIPQAHLGRECRERRGSVLANDKYKSLGNEDLAKGRDYKRPHRGSKA